MQTRNFPTRTTAPWRRVRELNSWPSRDNRGGYHYPNTANACGGCRIIIRVCIVLLGHGGSPFDLVGGKHSEPETGIEPASSDYKTVALPLSYTGMIARRQPVWLSCRAFRRPSCRFKRRKDSTRKDVHRNGCTPAIGGRLSGRHAGCRVRGVFHGARLLLSACQGPTRSPSHACG